MLFVFFHSLPFIWFPSSGPWVLRAFFPVGSHPISMGGGKRDLKRIALAIDHSEPLRCCKPTLRPILRQRDKCKPFDILTSRWTVVSQHGHRGAWRCLRALRYRPWCRCSSTGTDHCAFHVPCPTAPCDIADRPHCAKSTWPRALTFRSLSPGQPGHGQHHGQRCVRKAAPFTSPSWSNTAPTRTVIDGFACSNLLTFDVLAYSNSLTLLFLPTAIHSPYVGNPDQLACMHTSR